MGSEMCIRDRGKKEPIFYSSAQAWQPCIYEGADSSFVPPTTAAVAVTISKQLWAIDHRPVLLLHYYGRPRIKQGGDGSLPSPVFGFIQRGGGRLCTVPCVWFYIRGGGSLLSPVSGFIKQGRTALYRPLCSVLCITGVCDGVCY